MHKFKSASAFRAFRAAAVLACAALLALPAAADFVYKAELTVSGYSGTTTLQNFPVLVRLSPDRISGFDYSLCQSDGKDIQFTSPDGETVYPHEIDTWNTDGESLIWVNVAELSGTETKIMFWFGNAEITEMPASSAAWCTANGSGYYGVVWHFAETIDAAAAPTTLSADSAKHATDKDMDAEPMKGTYGDMSVMVSCPAVIGNGRVNAITTIYNTGTGLNAAPCYGDTIGSDKALSFSGWYVLDAKSSLQHYLAQEYNSFVIQTGGSCNDILVDCGSGVQVVSANAIKAVGVVPAEGEWFHLAVTFLGAEVRIYVNGELVGSGTTAKALHYPYTSIKTRGLGVTLGNGRGSQHYALKGSYDEVRILSNVASADWVKAEYETATEDDYLTYGAATRASSGDSLVITADSAELGGGALSPTYGTINEFSGPLQLTALSADVAVSNNLKIAFVGWELYRLNSGGAWDLVDWGDGTSYSYVHQEGTNDRFVWKYVRKRPLTLAVYPEAAGSFSVEGAAVGPGTVWLTNQTTLAVGPAAAEAVESNFHHGDLAKNSGTDDITDFLINGTETGLLIHGEKFTGTFGCFQSPIKFSDGFGGRFFTNDVKSGFHCFNGDVHMLVTAAGIDDQFNIFILKQFTIVGIVFAIGICPRIAVGTPLRDRIGNCDHIKTLLQCGHTLKQMTVDVSAAAALSDDTNFDLSHFFFLSCGIFY